MTAKTRLTKYSRAKLNGFARKLLTRPDSPELAEARKGTDALVRRMVETRYPPADMAVLQRYDVASEDRCIRIQLSAGGVVNYALRPPGTVTPGQFCRMYVADSAVTAAVARVQAMDEAVGKRLDDELNPYYVLVAHSRYFEDVVATWPEAESMRGECGAASTALVPQLSPEMLAAIQAGVAERAAAAAGQTAAQAVPTKPVVAARRSPSARSKVVAK